MQLFEFTTMVLFFHWIRCHKPQHTTPDPTNSRYYTTVTIGSVDYFQWNGDCSIFNAVTIYYKGTRACQCKVRLNIAGTEYYKYGSLLSSQHNLISCFYSDSGVGANLYLLSSSNYLRTNLISRYTYIKNYVSRNGKSDMYNVKGKYYISIDHVNQYTFNSNHPLKRIYSATFTISTENYGSNWEKYLLKWSGRYSSYKGMTFQVFIRQQLHGYGHTYQLGMLIIKVAGTRSYAFRNMLPTYSPHPAHMNKHSGSSNHHDTCEYNVYKHAVIGLIVLCIVFVLLFAGLFLLFRTRYAKGSNTGIQQPCFTTNRFTTLEARQNLQDDPQYQNIANAKAVNTNPNVYGPNPKPPSNQPNKTSGATNPLFETMESTKEMQPHPENPYFQCSN